MPNTKYTHISGPNLSLWQFFLFCWPFVYVNNMLVSCKRTDTKEPVKMEISPNLMSSKTRKTVSNLTKWYSFLPSCLGTLVELSLLAQLHMMPSYKILSNIHSEVWSCAWKTCRQTDNYCIPLLLNFVWNDNNSFIYFACIFISVYL